MRTKVVVKQRDSSGFRNRYLSVTSQMEVNELVELFLVASFEKQQEILIKLRK